MKTKRVASLTEKMAMAALIKEHADIADGLVAYHEGWNDDRIAITVSSSLNRAHAAGVRVELYGRIREKAQRRSLSDRVAALEEAVGALAALVGPLTGGL